MSRVTSNVLSRHLLGEMFLGMAVTSGKYQTLRPDMMFTAFKGRVERIIFFASFKLPLFNEYEMVFIIA